MLIYKGAEAELRTVNYLGIKCVKKTRVPKTYRIKELDTWLRKERTKREIKMMCEAGRYINVPKILDLDLENTEFIMEFIPGKKLRDVLNPWNCKKFGKMVGEIVRILHDHSIIHNDLTTSNFIWTGKELYLIDFGLSFRSARVEDKAVDLLVFKRVVNATHSRFFDKLWKAFVEGYGDKNVIKHMAKVESRARYL
jgi:N6-L-threonylcarbamoyladenine synthase/protein kinase Bud32